VTPYGGNHLYDMYSFYQNTELNADFESWVIQKYPEHEQFALIYADVVDEFEALKKEYGFVNFNTYS
jgi:DNA helicase-2/ATP-dependent DNA helicase PcrA